ncbi:glutamine amidotransferase [Microterricola viridarii]|uniref:Uncharacterized membrane protein n=1 Tax=Microterricola viridarii TaxID=412690 RepID=A0A1H1MIH8_9MICO|nr:glutamine amidotransferase [Microterricola viridarii]SDR86175.1 Uncharacterized membrane protein [Microterricola viridarii]
MARVLLAGESWSTTSVHTKGFDSFTTTAYEEGAADFIAALEHGGHSVVFQPNHVAAAKFPTSLEELREFDVVVLSDIGANTLLIPPQVFSEGRAMPNRLELLAEWTRAGGSLLMVGGYLSFMGIEAKANYRNTALAAVLPVEMEVGDDREETPQGAIASIVGSHPITQGLDENWPAILGYHRVEAREGAEVLATVGAHPLLVVDSEGAGRTAAFLSDMAPHWLPKEFLAWAGYEPMWQQLITWLARESE